jgi:serine protease Do
MSVKPFFLKTWIVLFAAGSAFIGAITGVVILLLLMGNFGIQFRANKSISDAVIESRIIELIEEESATIAVVERVTPAVVSIIVKKSREDLLNSDSAYYYSPFFISNEFTDEEVSELVEVSSGTGFFVTEDGYLLTNRHVVDSENASFFVMTSDDQELSAELIGVDPFKDIAVLKVEGEGFSTVTLADSDNIRIGQTVIAIGNTLSEFRNTVTKGVVSGINRRVIAGSSIHSEVIEKAIQTDAAINPGNSGGPLINLLGEVIGINTAVSYQGESIAFAIPINEAKRAIADVQNHGRIVRPWLGVRYVLVVTEDLGNVDIDFDVGALVVAGDQPGDVAVFEGSPADESGIQEGDVILAVNGAYLTQDLALAESLSLYHPGDEVTLTILREENLIEILVILDEYSNTL